MTVETVDFSNRWLYNEKYIKLLHDKKRYLFLMWGWWSGKSVFVSQKEIIRSFWQKDKIMCVRKIYNTLKDSCFSELKRRIIERKLEDSFEITRSPMLIRNKLTGCEFIFKWLDDPEKVKSVEWVSRIWIEEATELTQDDFDQLDLRLRGKKEMQVTCSFNPTDAEHRINEYHRKLWNTESQTCLHSTYKDNAFVWEEYEKVMDRLMLTNHNYYNIYALGQWWVLEWVIYNNRSTIDGVPKEAALMVRGLDFWFTNDPSVLIDIYQYNWKLVIDERVYETWLTNNDLDARMTSLWMEKRIRIYWDCAEPKSIEELKRRQRNIEPVKKGTDSIKFWIDTVKQFHLLITKNSANVLKEIKKYCRWMDKKTNKPTNEPVDLWNHAMDAMRYAIMMKFDTRTPKTNGVIRAKR